MPNSIWIDSVLSGLAGGVLASVVTVVYSNYIERKREQQARTANSFSLISTLEAFTISCAGYIETASEEMDISYHNNDRRNLSKLATPTFVIPPNVDFRPIGIKIASQVLTLPFLVRRSNDIACGVFAIESSIEATHASIEQFGIRGLAAWELASSLRGKSGIPPAQFDEDWTFLDILRNTANPAPIQAAPPPPPPFPPSWTQGDAPTVNPDHRLDRAES